MDVKLKAFLEATASFAYLARPDRVASPKKVIKAYHLTGAILEPDYLLLMDAIEDRNRLSQVYDSASFNDIFGRFGSYAALYERIGALLTESQAS